MGLMKEFKRSAKKSKKITQISRAMCGMSSKIKNPFEELYILCETDPYLSIVLIKEGGNREIIETIFNYFRAFGYGWTKGHYIPVSAFAFTVPFEYLLQNKNLILNDGEQRTHKLFKVFEYFDKNKTGLVIED